VSLTKEKYIKIKKLQVKLSLENKTEMKLNLKLM